MVIKLLDLIKGKRGDDWTLLLTEDLATEGQIRSHVEMISKENIRLNLQLDDRPLTYGSTFAGVYSKFPEGILIDTLIPVSGNRYIEESRAIAVSYQVEGASYTFDSKYMGKVEEEFTFLKIAFPKKIKKIQKRSAFRISPAASTPIMVDIGDGTQEEIADISVGGISFFTAKGTEELKKGRELENVTFSLPGGHTINAKAVVRILKINAAPRRRASKNKCGIEFVNLRPVDSQVIAHYLMERQREIIKRSHRELT